MSPPPRIVDELGRELVRAARETECRERGRRGARLRSRMPRTFFVGLLALLGLAAAAAAASLIIGRGEPIAPAAAGTVPVELRPVPGSARLNGLDVPDPDGGPAWDLRTSRSRTGAVCATVGQVLDGELGLLGLDRRFRALPAGAADTCSTPQRHGATLAGARAFRGGGSLSALTVVNGVAAPGVRRVVAVAGGRTVPMRLGAGHAFLAVFRGLPEQVRPRIVLTEASGRRTTLRFADSGEFIAADPSGGSPWALKYGHSMTGQRCVSAQRERGPDSPLRHAGAFHFPLPSATPWRCGDAARGVVAIARFVPSAELSASSPWGLNPARTIAWGIAPAGARAVVLTGAGAPRRLTVDRADGGFLAVLGGRVDPRRLRVSAGGRRLDPRAARGRQGQALVPAAVPAWRSVASALRGSRPVALAAGPRVVAGSVAISRHADDPTGGPAWLLRTWSARLRGRVSPGMQRGVACYAIGIERGGTLVEPRAGGTYRPLRFAEGMCWSPRALADRPGGLTVRTYVADPDATEPRPERVVVAGLLGDGVRSAQLLGAGAPRTLTLGRHGTFLAVLGPEHAGRPLRVRSVRAGGRVLVAEYREDGPVGCTPTPGTSARVADPDGRQPWTVGAGTTPRWPGMRPGAGGPCLYIGRLLGDRLAFVFDGTAWLQYGLFGSSGGSGREVGPRRPLVLDVQGPGSFGQPSPAGPPSPAQVARRTLPGRSVVSGQARRDVRSITLSTPRDVRALRPSPGGTFIAVYDGPWYGGEVVATLHLRDGRTLTRRQPAVPGA